MKQQQLKQALVKKALGYDSEEVVEEFVVDGEGSPHLSKRKVATKHFAPDMSALKLLIEKFYPNFNVDISSMTEDELLAERKRIVQLLKEEVNCGD